MFRSQSVEGNVAYHKITYRERGEIMNQLGINEKVQGERVTLCRPSLPLGPLTQVHRAIISISTTRASLRLLPPLFHHCYANVSLASDLAGGSTGLQHRDSHHPHWGPSCSQSHGFVSILSSLCPGVAHTHSSGGRGIFAWHMHDWVS